MENAQQSRAPNSRILNEQQDLFPLHFVTYNHPSQGRARKSRKVVRSHVAKLQHEKTRQKKTSRSRKLSSEEESVESDNVASRESSTFDDRASQSSLIAERHEASPLRYEASADSEVSTSNSSSRPASRLALRDDVDDGEEEPPPFTRQLGTARVNPFSSARDPTLDWTVDVPAVIDRYLENARIYLVSQGMRKVAQALHGRLVKPQIYLNGLLFNAVTTLSVTSTPALDERPQSDAMVLWLRTNFLMAIQKAMREPSYDPNALAIGIALLIAWELDVGNPYLCQLHLRALPSIVDADSLSVGLTQPDSTYHQQDTGKPFRGGRRIPSGLEFYRSQNLLPASLMFHVGSLVYWDESAPGASYWMRQLWSSIAACAPVEGGAQRGVAQRSIGSRVAQLVRQAGIMLGSFIRSRAGERPVAQPQLSGIQAQWHSTLCDDWREMIGTIYDGILLWCLCVFCVTSGYQDKHHLEAISLLLFKLEIRGLEALSAYLATYVWPSSAHQPLVQLCEMSPKLFEHGAQPS